MSTVALTRDALAPRNPDGIGRALLLAIVAHALLIAALTWGIHWRSREPEGVVAELWSAVPQVAAPRAVAPEPTPPVPAPTPSPPPPAPRVEPSPPPRVDPQIAIERAAREKARREEAERAEATRETARRADAAREVARRSELARREDTAKREAERERQRAAEEREDKKRQAEKTRQEEARLAALREATLKRMMGQAGATGDATATGSAARTSGPSSGYAGRIKARIKPNIVLTGSVDGNPLAEVELRLAPDGTIVGRRLVKSSGSAAWDETVLRAIDKTEVLPRDVDGRVPAAMVIEFRPRE